VRLDRARAEDELLGHLAVSATGGDELGDLALARRKRAGVGCAGGARNAVSEPAELARGLVAAAERSEAVELGLRRLERLHGGAAIAGGGTRNARDGDRPDGAGACRGGFGASQRSLGGRGVAERPGAPR
jgi:hypothetical protein